LPEIDRQLARHEPAGVIADDANLGSPWGNLRCLRRIDLAIVIVVLVVTAAPAPASTPSATAMPGVVIVVVVIVASVVGEHLRERHQPHGGGEEQAASSGNTGLQGKAPGAVCRVGRHEQESSSADHDACGDRDV
jgi:hypothetical protein